MLSQKIEVNLLGRIDCKGHDFIKRIYDPNGLCPTLTTVTGGGQQRKIMDSDLRIRKLTPRETWRLMGFDDEDFDKAAQVNSNTQLYKQAGNSIVVNVLEEIFRNLFEERNNMSEVLNTPAETEEVQAEENITENEEKKTKKKVEKKEKVLTPKEYKQTHPISALGKLALARKMFLDRNIKKTGANTQLEFMYHSLSDIVPPAIEIFFEVGLISTVSITNETASMQITNIDDPDDSILFSLPFKPVDVIVSNMGKKVTNEIQALGSSVTYYRRYLYQIALDIVEHDDVDSGDLEIRQAKAEEADKKRPVSEEKKQEIKKELTNTDAPADKLQIKGLKNALKTLLELDPGKKEFVTEITLKTEKFTKLTKSQCEQLIDLVSQMITELEKEAK